MLGLVRVEVGKGTLGTQNSANQCVQQVLGSEHMLWLIPQQPLVRNNQCGVKPGTKCANLKCFLTR